MAVIKASFALGIMLQCAMFLVVTGWCQPVSAQSTLLSDTPSGRFVWPPSDIIPYNLGVSTFGARPPFPAGMEHGTVNLRPEKLDEVAVDLLHAGGFRYVNIWMEWSRVEQLKGKYDFSLCDKHVERLRTKESRPIFTFCYGNSLYCKGKTTKLTECVCEAPLVQGF